MARRNTKALEKASDIDKKIQEYMKQKEELLKKAQAEIGAYILEKWDVDGNLEKVYETIDLLTDDALKIIKEDSKEEKKIEKKEELQDEIETTSKKTFEKTSDTKTL
ncbi:hypothetical protein [Halalkalibacter flavus]|uniref:hypothetical protein n=1 Tax=Halalkalibacter flavus TaxID=3090668 RepID=UPI002FC646E9